MIAFDNRGVGASGGYTPDTIEAMARDAVLFIRALGFEQVDLPGLSMGGFIAQVIAAEEPQLVRRVVLAGTGPAGGPGIDKVTALTLQDIVKGLLTRKDPKRFLFFTDIEHGRREAPAFLERLKERTEREHLDLAARLPRAELFSLYPDAGHGGIFQYHDEFATKALDFLESWSYRGWTPIRTAPWRSPTHGRHWRRIRERNSSHPATSRLLANGPLREQDQSRAACPRRARIRSQNPFIGRTGPLRRVSPLPRAPSRDPGCTSAGAPQRGPGRAGASHRATTR
ncbi:alpha/beta fold hydrolase [Streptomyces antimycoticus]|uniref:alpha/beta fold hydrolase n=1 Tax=Streptomyces antimycoticus TaxID=68175 RepID=UPI0037D1BA7B